MAIISGFDMETFYSEHQEPMDNSWPCFGCARIHDGPSALYASSLIRTAPYMEVAGTSGNFYATKLCRTTDVDGHVNYYHPLISHKSGVCTYGYNLWNGSTFLDTINLDKMPHFDWTNATTFSGTDILVDTASFSAKENLVFMPLYKKTSKLKGSFYDQYDSYLHVNTSTKLSDNSNTFYHSLNYFPYYSFDFDYFQNNKSYSELQPSCWAIVKAVGWTPSAIRVLSLFGTDSTDVPAITKTGEQSDFVLNGGNHNIHGSSDTAGWWNVVDLGNNFYFLWAESRKVDFQASDEIMVTTLPLISGGINSDYSSYGIHCWICQYGVEFNKFDELG